MRSAGVYWVVAADTTDERRKARPVWGVWRDRRLLLSIGSPKVHGDQYDDKYDWAYSVDAYGPFSVVAAETVLAWRAAAFAGRDGFRATGKWRFGN